MNIPKKIRMEDEDPYNIGGFSSSDDDKNESSDDELGAEDILKYQKQESGSSSEDEFEKEMEMEIESVMRAYEDQNGGVAEQKTNLNAENPANDVSASDDGSRTTEETNDVYSEDYFSSGSDDEHLVGGQGSKSKERRKVLTNDELLYDPDMDDEDEKWVIKQRRDHRQKAHEQSKNTASTSENQATGPANKKKTRTSKQDVEKDPSSDAILSCPACMTTLCIDCQRHEIYKNQYRAMFVMNCKVVEDEVLQYNPPQQLNSGKKRKKGQKGKFVQQKDKDDNLNTIGGAALERYHPVTCTECSSEVAVYDSDEVYHFFNVLASHA